jgi:hypothetical protein
LQGDDDAVFGKVRLHHLDGRQGMLRLHGEQDEVERAFQVRRQHCRACRRELCDGARNPHAARADRGHVLGHEIDDGDRVP